MTEQAKIYQDFYNKKITLEVAVKKLEGVGLGQAVGFLREVFKDL